MSDDEIRARIERQMYLARKARKVHLAYAGNGWWTVRAPRAKFVGYVSGPPSNAMQHAVETAYWSIRG